MSGDSEEGREPRKDTAGNVETCTTETSKCLNSWDVQSKHIQSENGVAEALYSGECRGGGGESYVLSSAISFQERAGKPGGEKGILIQNERTGALSTLNNQPVAYGISSYCSNGMKSDNPKSGFYEAETSRTLDLNGGSPACNQGGIAVVQGADMYNGNLTGNVAATLNATSGDSPTHSGPSVCILNDQGGERMNCSNGVTSTLRAEEHGHQPIVCLEGNGSRPSHQGDGYKESDICYTLNSTEHHAVCIENHPHDSRVKVSDDGIVQTLNGRMGTGGGNVPLIMESGNEK